MHAVDVTICMASAAVVPAANNKTMGISAPHEIWSFQQSRMFIAATMIMKNVAANTND